MILVAGVGNVLLGDDGFGVEVVRRLRERPPPGAKVVDFGIRGLDLAYALCERWDAVILVDAARRGRRPGTLTVLDPSGGPGPQGPGPARLPLHDVDPVSVLQTARALGAPTTPMRVVACEPERVVDATEELTATLSAPVAAAVGPALELVESLVKELGHA